MVCSLCMDAGREAAGEFDTDSIEYIMRTMAADLPDHLCRQVESGGAERCACECRKMAAALAGRE